MLVVVIKGTLFCPSPANRCTSSMSKCGSSWLTIFTGEPGFSAPVYEIDYGPRQPACDVLLGLKEPAFGERNTVGTGHDEVIQQAHVDQLQGLLPHQELVSAARLSHP